MKDDVIEDLTRQIIDQYEHEKEIGHPEYIKISKINFYKGLIKFIKLLNKEE